MGIIVPADDLAVAELSDGDERVVEMGTALVENPALDVLGHDEVALGDQVVVRQAAVVGEDGQAMQALDDGLGAGRAGARQAAVGVVGVLGEEGLEQVPVAGGQGLPEPANDGLVGF